MSKYSVEDAKPTDNEKALILACKLASAAILLVVGLVVIKLMMYFTV